MTKFRLVGSENGEAKIWLVVLNDVTKVQKKLLAHHIHPGMVDGLFGQNTLHAIEVFQRRFMSKPDGLIEPGQETERHLFGEDALEVDGPIARVGGPDDGTRTA